MLLQRVLWASVLMLLTGCAKKVKTVPAGVIILKNIDGEPCRDGDYQQFIAPGRYWCIHDCESMDLWDYQKKGCLNQIKTPAKRKCEVWEYTMIATIPPTAEHPKDCE